MQAQRARCQRWTDLNNTINFRIQNRLRKQRAREENDKLMNSKGHVTYPEIKIMKDPLCYAAFLPFLSDLDDNPEKKVFREMDTDMTEEVGWPAPEEISKPRVWVSSGASEKTQTDPYPYPFGEDLENKLVANLVDKVPQQATLEVMEEEELYPIKSSQQQTEMEIMYVHWAIMKEEQWQEWLRAWNEIRMLGIMEEDAYLQEKVEMLATIAFARTAMDSCRKQVFHDFQLAGYCNKDGVPYQEMEQVDKDFTHKQDTLQELARSKIAERILDSALLGCALPRFYEHM